MREGARAKRLAGAGLVVALGIGVTVGVVSAVGASSRTARGVRTVSTDAVTTAQFSFTLSVSGLTPSAITLSGTGEADLADDAASVVVDVPGTVAQLIPGGSSSPEVVDAVLVGNTVYLNVPSLSSMVGAPWISLALPSQAASAVPGMFTKVATFLADVNSVVSSAETRHATVSPLGGATVDGVQASGEKIVAQLPSRVGDHSVTASLWADATNHLVRATVATSVDTPKGPFALTATVDVTGYDVPVTITAPPPSQVKPIPLSLVEGLLGSSAHRAW
ncbi:MAG: hypothetical protein ACLPVF_03285 [Acidimicrobiales bacterium]